MATSAYFANCRMLLRVLRKHMYFSIKGRNVLFRMWPGTVPAARLASLARCTTPSRSKSDRLSSVASMGQRTTPPTMVV